jgi:hypothetical protein
MKSMKAYMLVLLLGIVTFMAGTSTAQNGMLSKDGPIAIQNPCNSAMVNAQGTATIIFHQNGTAPNTHEAAHFRYNGTATDDATNSYNVSLEAEAQDPVNILDSTATAIYIFSYHGVFAGQGGATTFKMEGNVGILVVDWVPTDDALISGNTSCAN